MLGALYYNYSRFGAKGLVAAVRSRWTTSQELIEVRHQDAKHPLFLRMGTSDPATYEQVFMQSEYDFLAVSPPEVIVDAGANIGLASVYFASRFPEATIIAVEPEAGNFQLLLRNIERYPNIRAIQAALWNQNSTIDIVDPGLGSWGFMTSESSTSPTINANTVQKVRSLTVSQLMREFRLEHIDILKIDIEGAELEVFESAEPWINQTDAMIVELHDRMKPGCSARFGAASQGFAHRWTRGENVYVSRGSRIRPLPSEFLTPPARNRNR